MGFAIIDKIGKNDATTNKTNIGVEKIDAIGIAAHVIGNMKSLESDTLESFN